MGQLKRERVGDSYMPIGSLKKNRVLSRDFVDVPTCRQIRRPPQSLIPAEARDPFSGSGRFCLLSNAFAKVLDGVHAGEVDGELLETRLNQVHVGINKTGHYEVTLQVHDRG